MFYKILADTVVIVHLLFIVFVLPGGLLLLWRPWLAVLHLPAAVWGAYIEFSGRICPLTPWENHFRVLAGEHAYNSSFVDHYLIPVMYPAALNREVQVGLGFVVIAINFLIYACLVYRGLQHRRQPVDKN